VDAHFLLTAQGYHDILSVLYLTFVPPSPVPSSRPRSRTTSLKRQKRDSGKATGLEEPTEAEYSMNLPQGRISEDGPIENDFAPHNETASPPYTAKQRDSPEWRTLRMCAEVVSLCRIRDAMGEGLEPMMGLLRSAFPT